MIIYLIRHTKPDVTEGTCYGQSDIDIVKEEFQRDLIYMKSVIPIRNWQAAYTSPLKRCAKLTNELTQGSCKIITDNRIKELNFGDWELQKWNNIPEKEMNEWCENYIQKSPPNGESYNELYERTVNFWKMLNGKDHKTAGIITHGGVIRSILAHIFEMPLKNSFSIKLHYSEIIKIETSESGFYQVEFLTQHKY